MKKLRIGIVGIVLLAGPACAGPLGFFPVSPQGTFLLQSPNDICSELNVPGCNMAPTFINLASLGVQAGDSLMITVSGGECFYPGESCTVYPPDMGALFSTSNAIFDPSIQNRVPGAIAPGAGATLIGIDPNLFTLVGDLDTTISQDFYVPATVVVPTNANYLVVGVLDSAYADNKSNNLGVNLNNLGIVSAESSSASVPEPSADALTLIGMSAIVLLWRRSLISVRKKGSDLIKQHV